MPEGSSKLAKLTIIQSHQQQILGKCGGEPSTNFNTDGVVHNLNSADLRTGVLSLLIFLKASERARAEYTMNIGQAPTNTWAFCCGTLDEHLPMLRKFLREILQGTNYLEIHLSCSKLASLRYRSPCAPCHHLKLKL
jgi:hypothetical protein